MNSFEKLLTDAQNAVIERQNTLNNLLSKLAPEKQKEVLKMLPQLQSEIRDKKINFEQLTERLEAVING